jgi:hypothetical protein
MKERTIQAIKLFRQAPCSDTYSSLADAFTRTDFPSRTDAMCNNRLVIAHTAVYQVEVLID